MHTSQTLAQANKAIVDSQKAVPYQGFWPTAYNQPRAPGYYILAIATSYISGAGLFLFRKPANAFMASSSPGISWKSAPYYEINGRNQVTAVLDPDNPYESPTIHTRIARPEEWNCEFRQGEIYFWLNLYEHGSIGSLNKSEIEPSESPNTCIISSTKGQVKWEGTRPSDTIFFKTFESFSKKQLNLSLDLAH